MAGVRKLAKRRPPQDKPSSKQGKIAKPGKPGRDRISTKSTTPLRLEAFGATDTGLVRSHNEDAFVIADLGSDESLKSSIRPSSPLIRVAREVKAAKPTKTVKMDISTGPGALLVVSDGMGGARAGEVASAIVIEQVEASVRALAAKFLATDASGASDDTLRDLVQDASHAVHDAGRDPNKKGMGATLTMAWIAGSTALVAQVGDSRAYLLRGNHLKQVTHDQSFVQMLVDAGAITPEAAELSPQKNVIMQVMGQDDDLDVVLVRLNVQPGDRLLLCSDGLSNMVGAPALAKHAANPSLDAGCAALIDAAKRGGGDDNITVLLAQVTAASDAEPPADDDLTPLAPLSK